MKKSVPLAYAVTLASLVALPALYAEEGVCHRCEMIREENKTSHQNFEYYDDYLKTQHPGQNAAPNAPAVNTPAPQKNVKSTNSTQNTVKKETSKTDTRNAKNANENANDNNSNDSDDDNDDDSSTSAKNGVSKDK